MNTSEATGADHFVSPGGLSSTSASFVDELALDPRFQELQTTLRTYLFDELEQRSKVQNHPKSAEA